jgi:hypothetical protein
MAQVRRPPFARPLRQSELFRPKLPSINVVDRLPSYHVRGRAMGETKVDIVAIDYITGGQFRSDAPILNIPVKVELACGQTLRFENGHELNAYLGRVDHRYDNFRKKFTVVCEECVYCDVGRKLRRQREEEELDRTSPYRTKEGLLFFPDAGPIKVRKP